MKKEETLIIEDIPVLVTWKKNMKHMYLRVYPPDGQVRVNCAKAFTREEITAFVRANLSNIKKKQADMLKAAKLIDTSYKTGATYRIWGIPYPLEVIFNNSSRRVFLEDSKLYMYIPEDASVDQREALLEAFYRTELQNAIRERTPLLEDLMGIRAETYRIRKMTSRWGSCNTREKRIWLNLYLAKKSPECLDYVICHELTHLLVPGHGHDKIFYKTLEEHYPHWRQTRALLNVHPLKY